MKTIGWIGLGSMGRPMVSNLLQAGYAVNVYNRSRDKAKELVDRGAVLAASPREIAERSDIIVTMVSDAAAVEAVLTGEDGILAGLSGGKIVVDMSTIGPKDSRRFAAMIREQGADLLDAPVSGSVKPAAEGSLLILVGGQAAAYETCRPMLDVLGKQTIHFGESGMGSHAKIVINLLLGLSIQAVSEALLLAEKSGLQREQVIEMISQSAVNTPIFQLKKENFAAQEFPAAFALKLMAKDFGLAMDAAREADAPLPATAAAYTTYTAAKATGKGDLDIAAVFLQLLESAGVTADSKAGQPVSVK